MFDQITAVTPKLVELAFISVKVLIKLPTVTGMDDTSNQIMWKWMINFM